MITGAIRRAKSIQSNHHHQQTNAQFFRGRWPSCCPPSSVRARDTRLLGEGIYECRNSSACLVIIALVHMSCLCLCVWKHLGIQRKSAVFVGCCCNTVSSASRSSPALTRCTTLLWVRSAVLRNYRECTMWSRLDLSQWSTFCARMCHQAVCCCSMLSPTSHGITQLCVSWPVLTFHPLLSVLMAIFQVDLG